jgi:hypothetical protein
MANFQKIDKDGVDPSNSYIQFMHTPDCVILTLFNVDRILQSYTDSSRVSNLGL